MNDDTLRQRVHARFADGSLPRKLRLSGVTRGILADRCAVCDRVQTEMRYHSPDGVFAFHERCHTIWNEEAAKPIR